MKERCFQATVEKKVWLTQTVLRIWLRLFDPKTINFRAGQHIILRIPTGDAFVERPFSIASSPKQTHILELLVQLTAGSATSDFLSQVELGTPIQFYGPKGSFRIKSLLNKNFFLASGTGIAPFRSMFYDLLDARKAGIQLCCLFFVRSKEELFLKNDLDELRRAHNNFNYSIIFRTAETKSGIPSDFVSRLNKYKPDKTDDFYLCGSSHFVQDMLLLLLKNNISDKRIHYEK